MAIRCNMMIFRFAHLGIVSILLFKYSMLLVIFSRHGWRAGTGWLSWTCNWRNTSWCGDHYTEEWGQCPTKNLLSQVSSFTSPLFLYSLSVSLFSSCFFLLFSVTVFSPSFFLPFCDFCISPDPGLVIFLHKLLKHHWKQLSNLHFIFVLLMLVCVIHRQ